MPTRRMIRSSSVATLFFTKRIEKHDEIVSSKVLRHQGSKPAVVESKPKPADALKLCDKPSFTIGTEDFDCTDGSSCARFGDFSKACFLCKKEFGPDTDLYMFGYLRAFCSPECRDMQYSLDEKNNSLPDTSRLPVTYSESINTSIRLERKKLEN